MLQIFDLSVRQILSSVNLVVKPGEIHCLIGKNGSGKTTLLKAVTGQFKFKGNIIVDGKNIDSLSIYNKSSIIGYIPQTKSVAEGYLVEDYFAMIEKFKNESIRESLYYKNLGIHELSCKKITDLSGGELQKVMIASVVCSGCRYLLMDEPTNNLDPVAYGQITTIIKDLASKGIGIVIATHDTGLMKGAGNIFTSIKNGKSSQHTRDFILANIDDLTCIYS